VYGRRVAARQAVKAGAARRAGKRGVGLGRRSSSWAKREASELAAGAETGRAGFGWRARSEAAAR